MDYTPERLAEILEAHSKWLRGEKGGKRADLTGADLKDAVFTDADLRGAVFTDADLRGAVFRNAVLRNADLTGADLRDADLRGADLTDAVYWNAIGNRQHIKSMQLESWSVTYTHDRLQIGCEQHAIEDWWAFDDARISDIDSQALDWWHKWKPIVQQIIEISPAEPTGKAER